jgi:translation initiation factor IF-2
LDAETINILADEFGFTTEYVSHDVIEALAENEPADEENLQPRPPIVTVIDTSIMVKHLCWTTSAKQM